MYEMRLYYRWLLAFLFVVCVIIFWRNYVSLVEQISSYTSILQTFVTPPPPEICRKFTGDKTALYYIKTKSANTDELIELESHVAPTFKWIDHKGLKQCRNSIQGSRIIVDDRGYLCEWSDRLSNGCCFSKGLTAKQYVCKSCLRNQCCSIYEHCVSCCQHPSKQTLLRTILANNSQRILKMVGDQFEFCLAKCRTSSESVIHENHYRNSKHKHCFGIKQPETELS